jgi:phage shock protein A
MLSRAQWYREQANLALQRGNMKRADPILRAGFDELVREWLRLAEQAEWIANQRKRHVF